MTYSVDPSTKTPRGKFYYGVVEAAVADDFWKVVFGSMEKNESDKCTFVVSHEGLLEKSIQLPNGKILEAREDRHLVSFNFIFGKDTNNCKSSNDELLALKNLRFFYSMRDDDSFPEIAFQEIVLAKDEALRGADILGYNLVYHNKKKRDYSGQCKTEQKECFSFEVFTLSPFPHSSKLYPHSTSWDDKSFTNLLTRQEEYTSNYTQSISTISPNFANGPVIYNLTKADVVRSFYLNKKLVLNPINSKTPYSNFSDNPKFKYLTIAVKSSLEETLKSIFPRDQPVKIQKINGFKCDYMSEAPSCGGQFKKTFESKVVNGKYQVSIQTSSSPKPPPPKTTLVVDPRSLYKTELPKLRTTGKEFVVNEFEEDIIYTERWQTPNPNSSHTCDVFYSHQLNCYWTH